jgi:hypothetical protein
VAAVVVVVWLAVWLASEVIGGTGGAWSGLRHWARSPGALGVGTGRGRGVAKSQ